MSINKIFEAIPFRDACSLHQRMLAGNSDAETRTLLRTALRNARCEQRGMKAEMKIFGTGGGSPTQSRIPEAS